MPRITALQGRLLFNSRGAETIEIDVVTDGKFLGRASAPSGASIGRYEVSSFPQDKPEIALKRFNENSKHFIGLDAEDPKAVYNALRSVDNTSRYEILGGSVAYALSIAAIDSASKALNIPLFRLLKRSLPYKFPFPLGNVLGGGAHAGAGSPDIQEILVCPIGAKNIKEALEMNFQVHKVLRKVIESVDKCFTAGRGDEGAWAPNIDNDEALKIVEKAVIDSGFDLGKQMALGVDFASSSFWEKRTNVYNYKRQGKIRNTEQQINFVNEIIEKYKLIYVEDPVNEEDFENMATITRENPMCVVTGDDLLVTNAARAKEADRLKACRGAILKVNQAGTLYDSLIFAEQCSKNGIQIITSHRSGESTDVHISHIAIGTSSVMLKSGISGGERVSKLNELIRISEYGLIEGMAEIHSV